MSSAAVKWALDQKIEDGVMKPVLVHLAWLHSETRAPFPSQQTLADATGHSTRAVREALRLLEFFNVIQRKARSNGAAGRTSDEFNLALGLPFELTKSKVRAARIGLRNRHQPPLASPSRANSQPAPAAGAPGTSRQGIGDEQYFTQEKNTQSSKSALSARAEKPTLAVVNGGRV